MKKYFKNLALSLFYVLTAMGFSCSAQQNSPTDKLIKGPFGITTEWQDITFQQALESAPQAQSFLLLSCNGEYDFIKQEDGIKDYFLNPYRFRRIIDKRVIEPNVILNDGKNDYRLTFTSNGVYHSGEAKDCLYIGYKLKSEDQQRRFIPENTQFISAKIQANTKTNIDSLYWLAPYYSRHPDRTWSNIPPSKIIEME